MAHKYFMHIEHRVTREKPISFLPAFFLNRRRYRVIPVEVSVVRDDNIRFFATTKEGTCVEPNTLPEIALGLFQFLNGNLREEQHEEFIERMMEEGTINEWAEMHDALVEKILNKEGTQIVAWRYYARPQIYGTVDGTGFMALCEIFNGLPDGLPPYIKSVTQMLDDTVTEITDRYWRFKTEHGVVVPLNETYDEAWRLNRRSLEQQKGFPFMPKEGEGDSMNVAEFVRDMYNFIQKYKPRYR